MPERSRAESDALVFDAGAGIERLIEIMARLRAPDGCPWDRQQDFRSIAPYTIEEACEVADAIEKRDMEALRHELGDLLLQVVYHARMAEEAEVFAFDDVVGAICDKMVRRHPHVFGKTPGGTPARAGDVDWEAMKAAEREAAGAHRESVLDDVPAALPALSRALKLTRRAATVGFDWSDPGDVLAKLTEETGELVAEIGGGDRGRMEEEYGDLMFVLANLARHLSIDPEAALRRANAKFERRFREVESRLRAEGRDPAGVSLAEMDRLWNQVKSGEKARKPE